jgi:hypothetical protein
VIEGGASLLHHGRPALRLLELQPVALDTEFINPVEHALEQRLRRRGWYTSALELPDLTALAVNLGPHAHKLSSDELDSWHGLGRSIIRNRKLSNRDFSYLCRIPSAAVRADLHDLTCDYLDDRIVAVNEVKQSEGQVEGLLQYLAVFRFQFAPFEYPINPHCTLPMQERIPTAGARKITVANAGRQFLRIFGR